MSRFLHKLNFSIDGGLASIFNPDQPQLYKYFVFDPLVGSKAPISI